MTAPEASQTAGKTVRVVKIDEDRRLVTVITNVVSDGLGNPVVDHDGDVMDIENLEDIFIKTFAKGGTGLGGEMHENDGGADVVAHHAMSGRVWKAIGSTLQELYPHVPDLSHMPECQLATLYIRDDGMWSRIKAGALPEVSIEGEGERRVL